MSIRSRIVITALWMALLCLPTRLRAASADYDSIRLRLSRPQVDAPEVSMPDSIYPIGHTYADRNWKDRLRKRSLDVNDTTIIYPRFINFCLNVYRWADRVFNSRDPRYVKGSKYHGKLFLSSDNWVDAYSFGADKDTPYLRMMSDMYANLGIKAKYCAVSIGYSFDMNSLFSGNKSNHKKWDFGFSCARFNLELHLWRNDGGTYIRSFGDYNDSKLIKKEFDGITFGAVNVLTYYMFNNKKFSMGAAQGFNNDQILSAGTPLVGFDFSSYRADFDFTMLPKELLDYYPFPYTDYRFRYQSYKVMGGYSFNWVANHHFVLNITALPGIGLTSSSAKSSYGHDILLALGGKATGAISYVNKRFFVGASADLTVNSFLSDNVNFFTVIQNYQLALGLKF